MLHRWSYTSSSAKASCLVPSISYLFNFSRENFARKGRVERRAWLSILFIILLKTRGVEPHTGHHPCKGPQPPVAHCSSPSSSHKNHRLSTTLVCSISPCSPAILYADTP